MLELKVAIEQVPIPNPTGLIPWIQSVFPCLTKHLPPPKGVSSSANLLDETNQSNASRDAESVLLCMEEESDISPDGAFKTSLGTRIPWSELSKLAKHATGLVQYNQELFVHFKSPDRPSQQGILNFIHLLKCLLLMLRDDPVNAFLEKKISCD